MSRRNLVLSGLGVATMMLSSGCDSTVGLDPSRTSFTKVIVPGACKVDDSLGQVDFSVMLLDGTRALLPDTRLNGEVEPVGGLLDYTSFAFDPAPSDLMYNFSTAGAAIGPDGSPQPVGLQRSSLDFVYSGGEDRKNDPRLVVMMLDQSGSLVGFDPFNGMFDPRQASDRADQRLSFFQQLIGNLPNEYHLSLVSFSGDFANITPEYSTPVRNKSVILEGLNALQYTEGGTTPLARALKDTRERVIEPNGGMNPAVILFTDGVEDGDPTDGNGAFAQEVTSYERDGNPIPVIVIHLQPPVDVPAERRGRNARLAELACRTGGEYIFLPDAEQFTTNNNLQAAVLNRIVGVWRLRADSTLSGPDFEPGGWLLSTQITVSLAGRELSTDLQLTSGQGGVTDTRAWFFKE